MKLGKNLFSVIVLVAIGCLLLVGANYFIKKDLSSLSVTGEMLARFEFLAGLESYLHPSGDTAFKWDNGDGYTIRVPSTESFFVAKPKEGCSPPATSMFRREISTAQQTLVKRGFLSDSINSSADTSDSTFWDYVQAYKKDDRMCLIKVNPDCSTDPKVNGPPQYRMYVSCGNMSAYADARKEQLPFLEALELKNKKTTVRQVRQIGQFFSVDLGGGIAYLKKEGDVYRVLTITQEMLSCSLVDKEQIPHELLHSDPARCECLDDGAGHPRGCA